VVVERVLPEDHLGDLVDVVHVAVGALLLDPALGVLRLLQRLVGDPEEVLVLVELHAQVERKLDDVLGLRRKLQRAARRRGEG